MAGERQISGDRPWVGYRPEFPPLRRDRPAPLPLLNLLLPLLKLLHLLLLLLLLLHLQGQ